MVSGAGKELMEVVMESGLKAYTPLKAILQTRLRCTSRYPAIAPRLISSATKFKVPTCNENMSGFEITGVVLGAIPIAIEIYDVYRTRSESLFKYAEVMRMFVRTLHTAHSRLRNCLEKLLYGRVEDQTFNELLENPKTTRWTDPGVGKTLRELLQHSFFGYVETLIAIRGSLQRLEILVGLNDNNSKSWVDLIKFAQPKYRFHKSVWRRITACIDHNKHIELLQSLDGDVNKLEQLTSGSLDLDPIRQDRKKKTKARQIESVRQFARSLHSALSTRWPCKCRQPHIVHLQLESLNLAQRNSLRFRLLFSYENLSASATNAIYKLKEIEVEPHEKVVVNSATAVSFVTLNTAKAKPPSTTALSDLCTELARIRTSGCCIGFVDDAVATHFIHEVIPSSYEAGAVQPPVSLRVLIASQHATTPTSLNLHATDRHKYELAVTLAASVLQLNKTPWLKDRWSIDDVLFLPPLGETSPARCAYISRPFMPASLPRTDTAPLPEMPRVRNEALFALGVALIELSLGKPLESFVEKEDLDENSQRTNITDFSVAKRLVNQVAQKEGNRYTDAVNRCIHGLFDGLTPDLTNERFRQGFYQGVVVELSDLLHDFIK